MPATGFERAGRRGDRGRGESEVALPFVFAAFVERGTWRGPDGLPGGNAAGPDASRAETSEGADFDSAAGGGGAGFLRRGGGAGSLRGAGGADHPQQPG